MLDIMSLLIIPFLVIALLIVLGGLRIANQYERAVVFRLGRYQDTPGPWLFWFIPYAQWPNTSEPRNYPTAADEQETTTTDHVPTTSHRHAEYRSRQPWRHH